MTIEELQQEKRYAECAKEAILSKFMSTTNTLIASVKYRPIDDTPIIKIQVEL